MPAHSVKQMSVNRTRTWRHRAAVLLAVLYAFCLVAPVTAFAFSQAATAPCHAGLEAPKADSHAAAQHHSHGMSHDATAQAAAEQATPEADTADKALPGKCCGLFCVTALEPPPLAVADVRMAAASTVVLPAPTPLLGRGSARIDRPPRVLPSL